MYDQTKHSHISVINMLRAKIGLPESDFDFLYGKSEKELEEIRDETIIHYNQALTNSNRGL